MKMKYNTLKMKVVDEEPFITRIDAKRLIDIDEVLEEPPIIKDHTLEALRGGKLGGHAIYLTRKWDWVLGQDTADKICLVPLRKESDLEGKRSEPLERIIFALAESNMDRAVCDDIIEGLEQHEKLQEKQTKEGVRGSREEDIEGLIEGEQQALEEARGSDMESYFDGRLSAFEDILDSVKGEGGERKKEQKRK